jgi:hypothetical protein
VGRRSKTDADLTSRMSGPSSLARSSEEAEEVGRWHGGTGGGGGGGGGRRSVVLVGIGV